MTNHCKASINFEKRKYLSARQRTNQKTLGQLNWFNCTINLFYIWNRLFIAFVYTLPLSNVSYVLYYELVADLGLAKSIASNSGPGVARRFWAA